MQSKMIICTESGKISIILYFIANTLPYFWKYLSFELALFWF